MIGAGEVLGEKPDQLHTVLDVSHTEWPAIEPSLRFVGCYKRIPTFTVSFLAPNRHFVVTKPPTGQHFKRQVKSHLPFASIIRSSPYSPR
jgi:hypothetical protein